MGCGGHTLQRFPRKQCMTYDSRSSKGLTQFTCTNVGGALAGCSMGQGEEGIPLEDRGCELRLLTSMIHREPSLFHHPSKFPTSKYFYGFGALFRACAKRRAIGSCQPRGRSPESKQSRVFPSATCGNSPCLSSTITMSTVTAVPSHTYAWRPQRGAPPAGADAKCEHQLQLKRPALHYTT